MSFVFAISTLYHLTRKLELKKFYRLFDYIAIHYAIAGTYTPLMIHIGTPESIIFLIFQWAIVLLGTIEKVKYEFRFRKFALLIFLLQGWSFLALEQYFTC
jgi:hemolysin III